MNLRTFEELHSAVSDAIRLSDAASLEQCAIELESHATPIACAMASHAMGSAHRLRGDLTDAASCYDRAISLYEGLGDRVRVAQVIGALGNVHHGTGNYQLALEYFRRAISIYEEIGHSLAIAVMTGNMGVVYSDTGNNPDALICYRRALAMLEDDNDPASAARITSNIGVVYLESGNYSEALEYCQRAAALHAHVGNKMSEAISIGNIGLIYAAINDDQHAMDHYQRALSLHEEIGDRDGHARTLINIGNVLRRTGDLQQALNHYKLALAVYEDIGNEVGAAAATSNIVTALIEMNMIDEATRLLDLNMTSDYLPQEVKASHLRSRAMMAELRSDLEEANTHLLHALAIAIDAGHRPIAADIHLHLRDLAQKRNDFAGYIEHNNEYQRITEEIRGQDATRKLAMIEAEKRIEAERLEKEKHRALLHNTLPPSIADRVLRGEQVNDTYENAVVLFMDLVGFTKMSSTMDPGNVVSLMNEIFTTCDEIIATHGLMKIKTIGDSYMAVAFEEQPNNRITEQPKESSEQQVASITQRAALAALEMLHAVSHMVSPVSSPEGSPESSHVRVRLGLHCGPLTAGVIGTERLQYDVWGDTVNVASRMESTSEPGRIHVSEAFALALSQGRLRQGQPGQGQPGQRQEDMARGTWHLARGTWHLALRGETELKGKGTMTTYWLEPA